MSSRSPSSMWVLGLFVVTVLCGTLAGAVVGGVAGYVMAGERAADVVPILAKPTPHIVQDRTPASTPVPTVTSSPSPAPSDTPEPSPTIEPTPSSPVVSEDTAFVQAVESALPAVVTVLIETPLGTASGSGFFISEDGYVVTNNHVVEGGSAYTVVYARGGETPATLIGTAPDFDLAVLQVEGAVPATIAWGDSGELHLGSRVIAIGSALGSFRNTVTSGVLSGFNRELGAGQLRGLLQTDAAVNRGNSGGPLLNLSGEVIGVNTAVVRGEGSLAEGLGFAIPSNIARNVVERLIETGEVGVPFLGVNYDDLSPQLAMQEGLDVSEGAILRDVVPDTPASDIGLRAGDIITAIDGVPIDERNSFISLLLQHAPGETITIDVLRDGELQVLSLQLGER